MESTTENVTSEPTATSQPQFYPVEFKGDGMEYTKLVLVNLALSIVTLGIFSAWAKVRTRKYVYGNMYINNANFNYHANPLQILKGRLIIGALFLMYGFGGKLSIALPIAAGVIFVVAMPWLIVRGMAFNLYNTSYRNIRFGFKKEYAEAYKVIFLGYLVTLVTLGLGAPVLYQWFSKFRVENSRYGKSHFKTRFSVGDFYGPYIKLIGCYVVSFVFFMICVGLSVLVSKGSKLAGAFPMVGGVLGLYGGILFGVALLNAGMFNIIYGMSRLEDARLQTSMKGKTLFKIYIQNILLGMVTLGFGIPYGMYRIIKYKAQSSAIYTTPEQFDRFLAENSGEDAGATADAAGDFWDMDIGF